MNQFQSSSLYIGDIDPDVTEANLFEIFNAIGPVASIRVCRDLITRRSLGYAYVNFHNVQDAEKAIEEKNNGLIKDRPCRIMWTQRDPSLRKSGKGNIFIKNLDASIDHKTLHDTFAQFGQILSCKIELDEKQQSKGYGYIQFATQEAAEKSMQMVNGMMLNGKKVFVGPFVTKKERLVANSSKKFTNIFVKNLPDGYTVDQLKELFAPFGPVSSAAIAGVESGQPKGFGFINFETPESAEAAVEGIHNTELDGKTLYVGRAQKRHERDAELRHKFEQMKQEQMTKYQGINLYIKNLDDDIDEEKLRAVFDPFGTIASCKVMSDGKGSKGFGFVCFSSPEEATKAVTEMNGKIVGNKPLYVGLAQRKEARKAQLEQQFAQRKQIAARLPLNPAPMPYGAPPMFYGHPGQAGFVYPQMMPARGGGVAGNQGNRFPGPHQGFQAAQGGNPGYVLGNNVGGGRGQVKNSRGMGGPSGGNRRGMKQNAQAPVQPHNVSAPQLSAEALNAMPIDDQKHFLGERLYPLIAKPQPQLAGKITGMILDSSCTDEMLHLIENPQALNDKIEEAIKVLKEHETLEA